MKLTGIPKLDSYKLKVQNREFRSWEEEFRELNELRNNLYDEGLTRHDWSYVYMRWKKLYQRLLAPTGRNRVRGPNDSGGRLQKEEAIHAKMFDIVENIHFMLDNAHLDDESLLRQTRNKERQTRVRRR